MAYSIVWPPSLPQHFHVSYGESGGVRVLRTPMDAGPAKTRRLGNKPDVLSLSCDMTSVEADAFETFVKDTIRGVLRFGLPHPRKEDVAEVRMIPGSDGDLYSITWRAPNRWFVSFQVEVLP